MHHTATAVLLAGLLLTGCATSSDDAKPEPSSAPATTTEAVTKAASPKACTDAVAEAAPTWDDWSVKIEGWEDDPRTPEACEGLTTREYMDAFVDGLDIAAACDTPDALPGRC